MAMAIAIAIEIVVVVIVTGVMILRTTQHTTHTRLGAAGAGALEPLAANNAQYYYYYY